jgi:NADPH:quinone reductase-like Zn-dependent oxidoreductase
VALTQFERADYQRGQRVVVQGAASALGLTTALLAKHLGAQVVVTSRDGGKRGRLAALGFETVLDSGSKTLAHEIRGIFGGEGADIIVDNLGHRDLWEQGMAALAPGGAIVSSGAFLHERIDIDPRRLYRSGHRIIGVRSGHKGAAARLWREVDAGFRSVVDRTFPLEEAAAAHAYLESGANVGRVALLNYLPA